LEILKDDFGACNTCPTEEVEEKAKITAGLHRASPENSNVLIKLQWKAIFVNGESMKKRQAGDSGVKHGWARMGLGVGEWENRTTDSHR
jgi:hypothetical protein